MAPDSSFRSRLREALHHSVVGRPLKSPEPGEAEKIAELQYEAEEDRQYRVDAEQSAWIADVLGGWWNREAGGVCLVIDRLYAADRLHGDAEIGAYADTLARYRGSLRGFGSPAPIARTRTLFSGLDDDGDIDEDACPNDRTDVPGMPGIHAPDTSDLGPGSSEDVGPFLFFDLETTGLTGGAGICAFLIGYGWFEAAGFRTRQYFLSGFGHEAAMLRMAGEPLGWPVATGLKPSSTSVPPAVDQDSSSARQRPAHPAVAQDSSSARQVTLVTYNGKTFDVPLIGGRYLFHRLDCPFDEIPHLDLLHPARRLWRHRPGDEREVDRERRDAFARYFRMTRSTGIGLRAPDRERGRYDLSATAASCALGALEQAVLGFRRAGDVPGTDIPTRYFHYARTGDVRPLASVLEHNRLDLVSLAALASVVARMLEEGPQVARNAHECLALGRLYERSGTPERATACYQKAVEGDATAAWRRDSVVEREALRRLAVRHRRERRYEDAAAAWQRLLDLASAHAAIDFEALHALAVHHEHRSKDLNAARVLVMRAIEGTRDRRGSEALRFRLARIERKISTGR